MQGRANGRSGYPRRAIKWCFWFGFGGCGLIAGLTIFIWIRSLSRGDDWSWTRITSDGYIHHSYEFRTYKGGVELSMLLNWVAASPKHETSKLVVSTGTHQLLEPEDYTAETYGPEVHIKSSSANQDEYKRHFFAFSRIDNRAMDASGTIFQRNFSWSLLVADWAIVAAVGIPFCALLATMLIQVRTRQLRRSATQCQTCGYDLRASPTRCPECGTGTSV